METNKEIYTKQSREKAEKELLMEGQRKTGNILP